MGRFGFFILANGDFLGMKKRIILAVTGSISVYKSAFLARLLIKAGFEVRVIMTKGAMAFVTPLTFQALTGQAVHQDLLDETAELGMGHIELAKWADLILIAPASANTLARLAMGMANDLLSTVCLATQSPIVLAPAMNQQMWANPAVQLNVQTLQDFGYKVIEPQAGEQACGDLGVGRLPEPEFLFDFVQDFFAKQEQADLPNLAGKHVLITAGATQEAIDPVRYLSNHSTGKMGFALAKACQQAGAKVSLVAGAVNLPTPFGIKRIDVKSAKQMLEACQKITQNPDDPIDILIAAAAVADYRIADPAPQKIKKSQQTMQLTLIKNPDILATLAHDHPEIFTLGFAAETQDIETYAKQKLTNKKLNMIACNDVSRTDIGFASDHNVMTVFFKDNDQSIKLAKAPKSTIAKQLIQLIASTLAQNDPKQTTHFTRTQQQNNKA